MRACHVSRSVARCLTTLIATLIVPAVALPAQEKPTEAEIKKAQRAVGRFERRIKRLKAQPLSLNYAARMLAEKPTRPATYETQMYVEATLKSIAWEIAQAERGLEAWKAMAAGDVAKANAIFAELEAAAGPPQSDPERVEKLRAAMAKKNMVEHARQLFRRRILEDRVSVIDRAVYHVRNLQGGYVPNERFEQQFGSLYGGQLKFGGQGQADPAKALQQVSAGAKPPLASADRKLQEVKRLFMAWLVKGDEAKDGLQTAAVILAGVGNQLDGVEEAIAPTLEALGYDVEAEEIRPIEIDGKTADPSDVVFRLDGRAGKYMEVLEGDGGWTCPEVRLMTHGGSASFSAAPAFVELKKKHEDPSVLFAMSAAGQRARGLVNMWRPDVREALRQHYESIGRKNVGSDEFLFYDYLTWEPIASIAPKDRKSRFFGYATQPGRSPAAIAAFRAWLKGKFGTIEKLNEAWGSDYAGFDVVDVPPDPYQTRRTRPAPLTYEHEMFLRQSVAEFIAIAAKALMDADPRHPVRHEMPGLMNYCMEAPLANHDLLTRVPARWVEMHKNDFWPALPALVYNGTITPLYDRVPVHTEFIWNWGRHGSVAPAGEEQIYRQGLQSIWRNCAWGMRALVPFAHYAWPGYDNGYVDVLANKAWPRSGSVAGVMMRDSAASMPVAFRRARRLGRLLCDTVIGPREVVVLQPSTAAINAYPYFSIGWSFSVHTQEAKTFHELLFNQNYQYGYALEESLFDGKAELGDYPVVILPYATSLADGMNAKLLDYVAAGGTLICSGVPGLYDKYGRDDGGFVREVFGDLAVEYSGDHFVWEFRIRPVKLKPEAQVLLARGEDAVLLAADYGKGRVMISSMPFGGRAGSSRLVPYFYRDIDVALGGKRLDCVYNRFEILHKVGGRDGRDYLFILNYDLSNALEDRVVVKGGYDGAVDLGIGPRFAVPLLPAGARSTLKMPYDHGVQFVQDSAPEGCTSFWLRLEPGEGTVIELVR